MRLMSINNKSGKVPIGNGSPQASPKLTSGGKSQKTKSFSSKTKDKYVASTASSASKPPAVVPYIDCIDCEISDMEDLMKTTEKKPIACSESKCHLLQGNGGHDSPRSSKMSSPSKKDQFPIKLQHMLSMVEELGLTHIVSWKPHGRAFEVKDVNMFVTFILPRFFKQTKITSFQRQLNLYGFQRMFYGADVGSSYHQYFLRGKPFLCMAMSRTKVKGVGKRCSRKATDRKGKEPNFYEMKYLPQLETRRRPISPVEKFPFQQGMIENSIDPPHTSWHSSERQRSPAAYFPVPSNPCASYGMSSFAPSLYHSGNDSSAVGQQLTPIRSEVCIEGIGQTMQHPQFWHGHTNTYHPAHTASMPFNSHPNYIATNERNEHSSSSNERTVYAPSLEPFPRYSAEDQDNKFTFELGEESKEIFCAVSDSSVQSLLSDSHVMCSTKDENPQLSIDDSSLDILVPFPLDKQNQGSSKEGNGLTEELEDIFITLMHDE